LPHVPAVAAVPDPVTAPEPLAALQRLGWREPDLRPFALGPGERPARVARLDRGRATLLTAEETVHAPLEPGADPPAVGDWAVVRTLAPGVGRFVRLLPRRSAFVRHAAGEITEGQVAAANVDVAFVVAALDVPLNLRRLERYLALAWQSGATPVVLLTKSDRSDDPEAAVRAAERVTLGVPVHAVSAVMGEGLDDARAALAGGRTAVLLGMSGAGKSTLANALLGQSLMDVQDVRLDGQGRHTTTHRELLVLPQGGVLIDTPGMRMLQLWDADEGVSHVFADLEALASECRFRTARTAASRAAPSPRRSRQATWTPTAWSRGASSDGSSRCWRAGRTPAPRPRCGASGGSWAGRCGCRRSFADVRSGDTGGR
jgi:ribosome biogenesis GTPase